MTLEVMLVVLGSALLHALWNALVRSASDKFSSTVWIVCGAAVWALPLLTATPLPASESWPYLLASVLIHGVYFTLVALAYRGTELGVAYPLMRGSAPALTAVLGVLLLGETLNMSAITGVALVCAGVLSMGVGAWRNGSTSTSLTQSFSQLSQRPTVQGFTIMVALLNAVVIASYTLVDGAGVRLAGNPWSYTLYLFIGTALLMGLMALARGRWQAKALNNTVQRMSRREGLRLAAWGGAGTLGAYGLVLWAFAQAPVALVAALRETSIVFALLLGAVFLKERLTRTKLIAVVLIAAGAVCLKLA
jgi:drug/metabolite transporter (DMT)-like permease